MSLFDNDVSAEEKKGVVLKLFSFDFPIVFESGKPSFESIKQDIETSKLTLYNLVNQQSWFILEQAKTYLRATNEDDTLS